MSVLKRFVLSSALSVIMAGAASALQPQPAVAQEVDDQYCKSWCWLEWNGWKWQGYCAIVCGLSK
jgi:hypothetical protein